MANEGTIASKLQLDGEKQYKQALNDAYRSLRVLRSELKAETAELGRNATQQDKARTKMASLQKQIKEQEKIVKTLEKALEDSKKEYADNQEVQDKWAEKLNKARAALAEMQNQLGTCTDDLEQFAGGMKDVTNSSGQAMTTVVSFNDAMKSIGSIASGVGQSLSGIFSATVDTMKDMVDEMFSLMSLAWSAAGDWKQIQTIWGGDLESIEKVYTAMGLQGIDASQVTSGIQKFITNVHNGNKDTMAALEQLHLSEDQFSSHWDFFVAAMDKASMFKGNDRYNLMTALFGDKKGAGMTDMLDNWREAMDRYQQDVEETGLHLHSDEIEELDKVSHKITEIQKLWDTIKTNIGAKLSDILNMDQLSEDTLEILRDIGAILNSDGEQRAELTLKLNDDIQKLLEDIEAAMENLGGFLKELGGDLSKSENPVIRFIGQLIESTGKILDWLGENGDTIIEWLNRLLPLMAANKVSEAMTGKTPAEWGSELLKLGIDISILTKLGKVFGEGAGAAIGSTASTFGSAIGTAITKAVPALAFLGTLLNPDGTGFNGSPDKKHVGDFYDENGKPRQWAIDEGYIDQNGNMTEKASPLVVQGTTEIEEVEEFEELPEAVYTLAEKIDAIQDWWDARRHAETGEDTWEEEGNAFDWLQEVLGDQFGDFWDTFLEKSDDRDLTSMPDIPSDWYATISGALKNLNREEYRGESGETISEKIAGAINRANKNTKFTIVVNLDGEEITRKTDVALGSMLSYLNA